ncbi:MAG TPA: 3'-5' exonuclease [Longilinea sp.]|nr:3'-5' exonuclease [Longilinea sp.]
MTSPAIPPSRPRAIQMALQVIDSKPVYIDTETTGIDRSDEIVEISIIDWDGKELFQSFVRPSKPIPPAAMEIHHITDEMVASSKPWPIIWPAVRSHLINRVVAAYNSEFDLRMLQQSLENYRLPWREHLQSVDIMRIYAEYRGEWDPNRRNYRFFKLDQAGKDLGISIPNAHRATADTLLARAVVHVIADLPYS